MAAAAVAPPEVQKEAEVIVSAAIAPLTAQQRSRGPEQRPAAAAAVERSDARRYRLAPLPVARCQLRLSLALYLPPAAMGAVPAKDDQGGAEPGMPQGGEQGWGLVHGGGRLAGRAWKVEHGH